MMIAALLLACTTAVANPNWDVIRDFPYGTDAQEKADFFLLRGPNHPLILFIHGGGWSGGDKSYYDADYARRYGEAGFSVVSMNYRLASPSNPANNWPAQLEDAQLLVRWLRHFAATLRIDPKRIGAVGDSAGAHLALFLGSLTQSRPGDRAAIFAEESPQVEFVGDYYGPSDMTNPDFLHLIDGSFLFGGRTYAQDPQVYADASPIKFLSQRSAPTFIAQGVSDTIVSYGSSLLLYQALARQPVVTWFEPFHGGHAFANTPSGEKRTVDQNVLNAARAVLRP